MSQSPDSEKAVTYGRQSFYDRHGRTVLEYIRSRSQRDDPETERFEIVSFEYGGGQGLARETRKIYPPGATMPDVLTRVYGYDPFGRRADTYETLRTAGGAVWARRLQCLYAADDRPSVTAIVELRGTTPVRVQETRTAYNASGQLAHSEVIRFNDPRFGDAGVTSTLAGDVAGPADFSAAPAGTRGRVINERLFLYIGTDLVAVLDENGNALEEYLTGPGANHRLAARYRPTPDDEWTVVHYHNGPRGNAVFLTSNDGDIVEDFTLVDARGGLTMSPRYVSAGLWMDPGSGTLQAGSRGLDPHAGQFTSPDPIGAGGGALYAFAGQNPVSFTDPGGEGIVAVLVVIGIGAFVLSEIVGWGAASYTGDPSWELSPTQQLYHAFTGHSYYGGLRSTAAQLRYQGASRVNEGAQGAAGLLGAVLPAAGAVKGISAYNLYRAAVLADVGVNVAGGIINTTRGYTVQGPLQAVLGLAGLGALRAMKARNPAGAGAGSGSAPLYFSSGDEYREALRIAQRAEAAGEALAWPHGGVLGGRREVREAIDDFTKCPGGNHAGYASLITDEGVLHSFQASSAWTRHPPGMVPTPKASETILRWLVIGIGRFGDSEFRTMEHILGTFPKGTKGTLLLATELFPCESCFKAIIQFQHLTGIEVNLTYKLVPEKQVPKLGALFDLLVRSGE